MPVYSRGAIEAEIERRKKLRPMEMVAPDYQEVMPETLGSKLTDQTLRQDIQNSIDRRGELETDLTLEKVQNEQALIELAKRRQELRRANRTLNRAQSREPKLRGPRVQGGNVKVRGELPNNGQTYTGNRNFAPRWGKDNTPEVSDLKRINPNAMLTGVNFRGRHFVVSKQVAPIFLALLDDLWAEGYRPAIIGGYNDRNIAGTNVKSLHSYGLAIDIDPERNPVQHGTNNHALPKNVAALAAKYGLSWGGNWNSYKDPMHFSVPYGGRE